MGVKIQRMSMIIFSFFFSPLFTKARRWWEKYFEHGHFSNTTLYISPSPPWIRREKQKVLVRKGRKPWRWLERGGGGGDVTGQTIAVLCGHLLQFVRENDKRFLQIFASHLPGVRTKWEDDLISQPIWAFLCMDFGGGVWMGGGTECLAWWPPTLREKAAPSTFRFLPSRCSALDTVPSLPGTCSVPPAHPVLFYFVIVSENPMENKNVARPDTSTYALQFEADRNVKKLTVRYANTKTCKQRPTRGWLVFSPQRRALQTETAAVGFIISNIPC